MDGIQKNPLPTNSTTHSKYMETNTTHYQHDQQHERCEHFHEQPHEHILQHERYDVLWLPILSLPWDNIISPRHVR